MFELHNAEVWPLHVLTLAAGVAVILLELRQPSGHGRWVALLLAVLWGFVGRSFLWNRYATINWAVDYVAPLFALQAILLLVIGTIFNALTFDRRGIAGRIALAIFGIVAYPCFTALFRRSWSGVENFGIAPDPTVIATLGFLLMCRSRLAPFLFPIRCCGCRSAL